MPMDADALRRLFVLANAFKEGDLSVGGTRDDVVRQEARRELLATRVSDIRRAVFVEDGVTGALARGRDRSHDGDLDPLTIGRLKEIVLASSGPAWTSVHRDALSSEVIAALAKVMTDDELGAVSRRIFNALPAKRLANGRPTEDVTIGAPKHFGSRIQPNSPGDDDTEILYSILEGLTHGCGDVIIGLNPAADEVDTIVRLEELLERVVLRLELPTRYCVLSNIVKQHQAQARTRVDVGFQSLAGTSKALAGMVGLDVDGILDLARGFDGLYFETGQGSAVTNGTAESVDMVTLESRAYGVARHMQRETGAWMIVNDVAGFIGPEVFRTPEQLERACLEDLVMAKLHGLTMGLDVCATFHMGIPPAQLRQVTERVVARGAPAYLMAVAGNADPMLGYLTTSFRDHRRLRAEVGRQPASAMRQRLIELGTISQDQSSPPFDAAQDVLRRSRSAGRAVTLLYARYAKAGGDTRSSDALEDEATRRLAELRERGFDLGGDAVSSDARLEAIYAHARQALYAAIQDSVIRDACPRHVQVRTMAADRDDYLAHPPAGERIRDGDAPAIRSAYTSGRPRVQIVISDGLNADAINEQLRAVLPAVRRLLGSAGCAAGTTDIVIHNGRVRAGYHVGQLLDPEVIVHIIGERPGTGLNTVSAYLTYGRDRAGRSRWDPGLDHSYTTAVCGIHPRGKGPEDAASEIVRTVVRMMEQRRSGVMLR
jgi:ethanolamine ammonia-lyase large subunit